MVASILKNVMASAAEAELGGIFVNSKEGEVLSTTLEKMGNPLEKILMQTDNSTASGIINETIKQRISKDIDMIFYWVRDRCKKNTS